MPKLVTATAFKTVPDRGTIELVKWIALTAMVIDHVGELLLDQGKFSPAYHVGRIAFPLFAFVLGFKLSTKTNVAEPASLRTVKRLFVWALISFLPFYAVTGRLWPPNIFFTLGLGALACWVQIAALLPWRRWLAYFAIFLASFGCDYFAPGVFLVFSICAMYRRPSVQAFGASLLCSVVLAFANWSPWTLMAIPIAALAHGVSLNVPRLKWFFYASYPLHLVAIALLAGLRPLK